MTDIDKIAREGVEIAAKATKGPFTLNHDAICPVDWPEDRPHMSDNAIAYRNRSRDDRGYDADTHTLVMFAHAGTHYASLCAAVLERGADIERLRAEHEKGGKA